MSLTGSSSHFFSLLLLNGSTILPDQERSRKETSQPSQTGRLDSNSVFSSLLLHAASSTQSVIPARPPGVSGRAQLQQDSTPLPQEDYVPQCDIFQSNGRGSARACTCTCTASGGGCCQRAARGSICTAEVRRSLRDGSEFPT